MLQRLVNGAVRARGGNPAEVRIASTETDRRAVEEIQRRYGDRIYRVTEPIDLGQHLPSRLAVLGNAIMLHAYRLYSSKFGMNRRDWRFIATLAQFAPMSYNDLANYIGMDRAGVSRAVASLLRRGYIERHIDRADKRRSVLFLTRKGATLYDRVAPLARARERQLMSVLSKDDKARLLRILVTLKTEIDRMLLETGRD